MFNSAKIYIYIYIRVVRTVLLSCSILVIDILYVGCIAYVYIYI